MLLGVAVLVFAELFARLVPPPDPRTPTAGDARGVLLHGSPWLLWELHVGDFLERGIPVHVNAAGFRDATRGPKTRARVLSVGDSTIYGYGVRDGEVFTSLLEKRFDADFINGGVPGYSTFQSLNFLDMRGLALDPDVLLVGSLWSDNNFDTFQDADLLAAYADFQQSNTRRFRRVLSHSVLFQWADWTLRVAPRGDEARKVGWMINKQGDIEGARRVDINDYAANLEAFADRMQAHGGGVVYLLPPNREDLLPPGEAPRWAIYRQVMRDVAARHHAPIVDGPAAFGAAGLGVDDLFQDQMHPTAIGHAVLAEAVAKVLDASGWPAVPLRIQAADSALQTYEDR